LSSRVESSSRSYLKSVPSIISVTRSLTHSLAFTHHFFSKIKQQNNRDDRIKFPQWGELKPKTPHGTLPVMTIDDGPMLTQSGAMLRYAGSLDKTGTLYPTDKMFDVEQAIGVVGDLIGAWSPNLYLGMRPQKYGYAEGYNQTDEGKELIKKMRTEFVTDGGDLTKYLKYLSDLIEKNGGTFLCGGDKPTIADCIAIPTIRNFTRGHIDHVDTGCVNNPIIIAYVERFCALPEIKGRYTTGLGA
jgi:glutathione S-transferase